MEGTGELVTVDELAAFLKVPKSWVYSKTRERGKNTIPTIRAGKYCRFNRDAVMSWLERRSIEQRG